MTIVKKLRFFFRFITSFFKKHYKTIFIGLILGSIFYFLIPNIMLLFSQRKHTLKIGIIGQYSVDEIPQKIIDDISYGLTGVNEKGEPVGKIASSWIVSDDGKTYTFYISVKELFWHNGQKFVPSDVNYNFKDVSVSVENNKIIFLLKEPFAPFTSVVSKPLFKKGLIGLGDYKISKIIKSGKYIKSILLVSANNGVSLNSQKLYRFYQNEKDLKTAFILGEIDILGEITNLDGLYLSKNITVEENISKDISVGLFFNTNKQEFSEKSFRQALAYSILKQTGEKRSLGPLNPLSWSYNPDIKPYKQDFERSKLLLGPEKSVYENININISTLPQYVKIAEEIKNSWKTIGINSTVHVYPVVPDDYDTLLVARKLPSDPDQYYFWHSTQEGNLSKFKNPRIDKLLEDGRKTLDKEERKNIYFDFQRFLIEESPAVFIIHPSFYSVKRN